MRRAFIGFLVVANVAIFGGLAAVWFAARQVTEAISTVPGEELEDLTEKPGDIGEPRTFLLVGSDSREGIDPDDFDRMGSFSGQRADVIMLLQIIPEENRVQLLSLPRDLRIVRDGQPMRINATFNEGPGAILAAVTELVQAPIHHYMQVDFAGFAGIVDAMGGIEMTFPYPARDRKSGFEVDAGTHVLTGRQAVSLARSRSYQELRDGSWVYVRADDIGRTGRQQDLLMAMVSQIERPSSLSGFADLVDGLGGFVITDDALDEDDIIELAWQMRNIDPDDIDSMTLPVSYYSESGVSYVIARDPEAAQALAAFRNGEPFTEAVAGAAAVQVQNGNGQSGSAGAVADILRASGYEIAEVGNSGREDYQTTLVVARPGALPKAEAITALLGYGEAVTGSTPAGIDVVVIVGIDATR